LSETTKCDYISEMAAILARTYKSADAVKIPPS